MVKKVKETKINVNLVRLRSNPEDQNIFNFYGTRLQEHAANTYICQWTKELFNIPDESWKEYYEGIIIKFYEKNNEIHVLQQLIIMYNTSLETHSREYFIKRWKLCRVEYHMDITLLTLKTLFGTLPTMSTAPGLFALCSTFDNWCSWSLLRKNTIKFCQDYLSVYLTITEIPLGINYTTNINTLSLTPFEVNLLNTYGNLEKYTVPEDITYHHLLYLFAYDSAFVFTLEHFAGGSYIKQLKQCLFEILLWIRLLNVCNKIIDNKDYTQYFSQDEILKVRKMRRKVSPTQMCFNKDGMSNNKIKKLIFSLEEQVSQCWFFFKNSRNVNNRDLLVKIITYGEELRKKYITERTNDKKK